ncbi:MAG: hypothetical protein HFH69_12655 [Lachnospiraceae bacterium]|nr:hypothetical protein [Lachnospiraceae bacterium]
MARYEIKESDVQEIIKCMEGVAVSLRAAETKKQMGQDKKESISSMEISKMFNCQHIKVFNMITRFITTEATEDEKAEFQFAKRAYNRNRVHEICYLTENGCSIYLEKICSAEFKKSKHFIEGAEKLANEVKNRFGTMEVQRDSILMDGKSRAECSKIKEIFDRFITGPGLEKREIAELTEKYQQFYDVMKKAEMKAKQSNDIEEAVFGVAIEAEMQGFIYGFRLYEELISRQLVVV